jgi:glycosyltransferase involved in cell wall biosynthesis
VSKRDVAPISAIVVGLNEGHLLRECLMSADFCDERLYVDLGSTDGSIDIAKELGWATLVHDRVPIGEFIVTELKYSMDNPWLLFIDPDERISPALGTAVLALFQKGIPPHIGALRAPWFFHFKGRRLRGTPWGGEKSRPFIAHRERFTLTSEVHRGRSLLDGYESHSFGEIDPNEHINHFWSSSWTELLEKHRRYLRLEGHSQYLAGRRMTANRLFRRIPQLVVQVVRHRQPFQDGARGILLSLFWITYQLLADWELFRHQKRSRGHSR